MRFSAMSERLVALLAYDGFQILDLTGPAAVFESANYLLDRPAYELWTLSPEGGDVRSSSGVTIVTRALADLPSSPIDSFLVMGAAKPEVIAAMQDPVIRRWAPRWAERCSRYGSVCSGALVLASLGLLNGKRAATHWDACDALAENFAEISVDPEASYVVDGEVWTSAGVTTGIDMALALVERDHGAALAGDIAKRLVVYARRPGHQNQFSALLNAQVLADNPFAPLIDWIQGRLNQALDAGTLAERAGLTERSFYRKFQAAMGQTPAQFVEAVRIDAATALLARDMPVKAVAAQVGMDARRLNAAFERRFGISAQMYRAMHARAELAEAG
jgi:transcriptional regulator GlxA family with amidase domain